MPATAGRVRMPADNRLSVSASLKTSEIWQKSVRYDPYAPAEQTVGVQSSLENSEKAKGLFALARLTGASSSVTPGSCRKCGQVGHLAFQCRNNLLKRESIVKKPIDSPESDPEDEKAMRRLYGLSSDKSSDASVVSRSSGAASVFSSSSSAERRRRRHNTKKLSKDGSTRSKYEHKKKHSRKKRSKGQHSRKKHRRH